MTYPENATAKERLAFYVQNNRLASADALYQLIMTLEERYELVAYPEVEGDER
jgi:hypothetical protein